MSIGSNVVIWALVDGFENYINLANITDRDITAAWYYNPSTTTIKNRIYWNSPVILLTQGHPKYKNHYLVTYGYKTDTSGNIMWMVHTGYYGDEYIIEENDVYRHKDLFICDTYVDYAVYINV